MGPGEKRELTEEEILQNEEYIDMMVDDGFLFETADSYDEEDLTASEIEEREILSKYGY